MALLNKSVILPLSICYVKASTVIFFTLLSMCVCVCVYVCPCSHAHAYV
jgi:hypothetical protein